MLNQTWIRMAIVFLGTLGLAGLSQAASTSGYATGTPSAAATKANDEGVKAMNQKNYSRAAALFGQALQQDPNNADIMNNRAFCLRKMGDLDQSIQLYKQALSAKPQFPQAHEYLGEAYLQAALKEVEILKGAGTEGQEYLKQLSQAIKTAAGGL